MQSFTSEILPNEVHVNYIRIPSNIMFGYDGLELFENLDLIWLRFNNQSLAYQIENNELKQNAYTKKYQQYIRQGIFNYKTFCFLEKTEEIYQYKDNELNILYPEKNQPQYYQWQIQKNKLKKFERFQIYDKFILSNTEYQIYINRRNNLKHVLRYMPKHMKVGRYQQGQFIFLQESLEKLHLFWKLSQNIKIIRKLNNFNFSTQFSLGGRYLLICYEQNKPYYLIDLSSMKTVQVFQLEENQQFKSSFFVEQLGLFIIHIKNISQQQIEDKTIIKQNSKFQTLQTQKEIKFIKFNSNQGLQVFYT